MTSAAPTTPADHNHRQRPVVSPLPPPSHLAISTQAESRLVAFRRPDCPPDVIVNLAIDSHLAVQPDCPAETLLALDDSCVRRCTSRRLRKLLTQQTRQAAAKIETRPFNGG